MFLQYLKLDLRKHHSIGNLIYLHYHYFLVAFHKQFDLDTVQTEDQVVQPLHVHYHLHQMLQIDRHLQQ